MHIHIYAEEELGTKRSPTMWESQGHCAGAENLYYRYISIDLDISISLYTHAYTYIYRRRTWDKAAADHVGIAGSLRRYE